MDSLHLKKKNCFILYKNVFINYNKKLKNNKKTERKEMQSNLPKSRGVWVSVGGGGAQRDVSATPLCFSKPVLSPAGF